MNVHTFMLFYVRLYDKQDRNARFKRSRRVINVAKEQATLFSCCFNAVSSSGYFQPASDIRIQASCSHFRNCTYNVN